MLKRVLTMNDIMRIDRVAGEFEVWLGEIFPFPKMKVKVLEQQGAGFLAVTNLHVLNKTSRDPEYMSGLGSNLDDALDDLITRFLDIVRENMPATGLSESDFIWSAAEDF